MKRREKQKTTQFTYWLLNNIQIAGESAQSVIFFSIFTVDAFHYSSCVRHRVEKEEHFLTNRTLALLQHAFHFRHDSDRLDLHETGRERDFSFFFFLYGSMPPSPPPPRRAKLYTLIVRVYIIFDFIYVFILGNGFMWKTATDTSREDGPSGKNRRETRTPTLF